MDEREFAASRQSGWERLAAIVRLARMDGIKALSREDIREIGPLYRRAASDLAYARAHAISPSLKNYLNQLVAGAYEQLYQTDTHDWSGLRKFFSMDFPRTFRRRLPFFLAALFFMLAGAGVGYYAVHKSHDNIYVILPPGSQLHESVQYWESGKVTRSAPDAESAVYASGLMVNNTQVSFVAFAFGILAGIPTILSMIYNGAVLGGMAALMSHVHQEPAFWAGILPHGVVELSETCIAGASGLSIGWAIIAPGQWRRRDALSMAAKDSVRLVLGGILLLIFAGLVEGFISHSLLPSLFKIMFGISSGIILYAYLFFAGRGEAIDNR